MPVCGRGHVVGVKIPLDGEGNKKPIRAVKSGAFRLDQSGLAQRIQTAANGAFGASHFCRKVFLLVNAIDLVHDLRSRVAGEFARVQVAKSVRSSAEEFV